MGRWWAAVLRLVFSLRLWSAAYAQIYKFEKANAPESKSLSLLYAFFIFDHPNATAAPNGPAQRTPYVQFKGLKLSSTSEDFTNDKLKSYQGLQIHLIKYEDLWSQVDTSQMCATSQDVAQGLSKVQDHLIIRRNKDQSFEDVNVYRHQLRFGEKEPDEKIIVKKGGVYYLVVSNCGSYDQASISGEVIVKNDHGFLPANEYSKMPFYAISGGVCALLLCIWLLLCVRWWTQLFNIHLCIAAVCALAVAESGLWYFFLLTWNSSGTHSNALFSTAVILSVTRSTCSYMLVLLACLGWGVTKPILDGSTLCRILLLSFIYIVLNVIREIVLAYSHSQAIPMAFVLLCLVPVSILNGGIFYWIFAGLTGLMETLESQGQTEKLQIFKKLWWILLIAIAFAVGVLMAQVFVFSRDFPARWEEQWMFTDGAPQVGYITVLTAIMCLWAPNEDSQRFAYSAQIDPNAEDQKDLSAVVQAEAISDDDVDVIGAKG
ncbi:tmem87a [Symbiodinium pilosum]|uniref:Tmem87a protein n=1 Tax=Symbiodinium pilosum TaxID=2952 RepID=A0A812RKL4_SYMPI|nr:tmem87a [Symbiodinium pilosum]